MTPEEMAAYYGPPTDLGEIDAPPPRDLGDVDAPGYFGPPTAPAPGDAGFAQSMLGPQTVPQLNVPSVPDVQTFPVAPAGAAPTPPPDAGPAVSFSIPASAPRAVGGPAPAPAHPSSGGAPAGPSELSKANKEFSEGFNVDKEATLDVAQAERQRADMLAGQGMELADEKRKEQERAQVKAADEAVRFRTYQEETQRQIDDVRATRIQPNRAYADSGSAAMAVFAGILGGMYQGLNKLSSNPAIDQMNRVIDRDIDAQKHDLDTKKGAIGERKSLLADMRATYKDEALAKAQAKNLYFEAAKEHLLAEASTYDSPIIQARVTMAVNGFTREQQKLRIDQLTKEAAARSSAAAAAAHQRQVDFDNAIKLQDIRNKTTTAEAGAEKDRAEGGKKTDEQAAHLGTELSKPELVNAKQTIDELKRKLINPDTGLMDGTRKIPGVGPAADKRENMFPGATVGAASNLIPGYGVAHYYGKLDPEERVGRMEWDRLAFAYQNAVTGSGGGEKEAERIVVAFAGARTPAEQAAAVRLADGVLAERESRIRAGEPAAAVKKYDARLKEERATRPQPVTRDRVK